MILFFFLFVVAAQAGTVFKHKDCLDLCGPALAPCSIAKGPGKDFDVVCYKNGEEEEKKCKKAAGSSSVCIIDIFSNLVGNENIYPEFQKWQKTRLAVSTTARIEAAPTTSEPATNVPSTVTPSPPTTSEVTSSTSTTPATNSADESPMQVQATEGSRVLIAGIGLAALVMAAIILGMCCRKSKPRPQVSETPLKVDVKHLNTMEDVVVGSERTRSAMAHL